MNEIEQRRLRMELLRELYFSMVEDCGTNASEYFIDFYDRIKEQLDPSFLSLKKHVYRCSRCKKIFFSASPERIYCSKECYSQSKTRK